MLRAGGHREKARPGANPKEFDLLVYLAKALERSSHTALCWRPFGGRTALSSRNTCACSLDTCARSSKRTRVFFTISLLNPKSDIASSPAIEPGLVRESVNPAHGFTFDSRYQHFQQDEEADCGCKVLHCTPLVR